MSYPREVELVGGPMDGERIVLPSQQDEFRIAGMPPFDFGGADCDGTVEVNHGRYVRRPLTVSLYDWQGES